MGALGGEVVERGALVARVEALAIEEGFQGQVSRKSVVTLLGKASHRRHTRDVSRGEGRMLLSRRLLEQELKKPSPCWRAVPGMESCYALVTAADKLAAPLATVATVATVTAATVEAARADAVVATVTAVADTSLLPTDAD